jgi:hypothetical protein
LPILCRVHSHLSHAEDIKQKSKGAHEERKTSKLRRGVPRTDRLGVFCDQCPLSEARIATLRLRRILAECYSWRRLMLLGTFRTSYSRESRRGLLVGSDPNQMISSFAHLFTSSYPWRGEEQIGWLG